MARKKVDTEQARTLPDDVVAKIRADIDTWKAGGFAAQLGYGPACICGLWGTGMPLGTGHQFNPDKVQKCQRHPDD